MDYLSSYNEMKQLFSINQDSCNECVVVKSFPFESLAHNILPGGDKYTCKTHNRQFKVDFSFFNEIGSLDDKVYIDDIFVAENQQFRYHLIKPKGMGRVKKVIFLFHGFNEKDWSKYLPWAKAICEGTQSAVVLFPIAFHMQRAPKHWSSKREMYALSKERKRRFPHIVNSSLSNVAISMRLHSMPQRFMWSGLQTYYDVIQFVEMCKNGGHSDIEPDFEFDFFAYSIGGFLAQILKFTNYKNYFSKTKICLFCSGITFNRLSPVSKFILDSEANVALYSFLVEHLDKIMQKDGWLNHFINENHIEGEIFYAMLDYQKKRDFREQLIRKYSHQLYAITLRKDAVIPSFEVVNALQGAYRDIPVTVEEMDFDYPYSHENPFPIISPVPDKVDASFNAVFDRVCNFFNA